MQSAVRALKQGYPSVSPVLIQQLEALDPDGRVPVAFANSILDHMIALTGNPAFALEAGRAFVPGDCGALDYALSTAATLREAIEIAGEYMHLVSDAFRIRLEEREGRALLCIDSSVPLTRAAADFRMAAFFSGHVRFWTTDLTELSCWFACPAPADPSPYDQTFGPASVRFLAPSDAFVFPAALLDQPLAGTDPRLHAVVLRHTELMAAELPRGETVSDLVRAWLREALPKGVADSVHTAGQLRMSVRTLSRKLEREGTSFKAILDELRRQLAFGHLSRRELSITHIARDLGFSEVATFHRAFKRWASQTPREYRTNTGRGEGLLSRRPADAPKTRA